MKVFSQEPQKGRLTFVVVFAVRLMGECTIERVAFVMNIVPCRELILKCKS